MKIISFALYEQTISRYAELSGDDNPIHTDSETARKIGFSGIVSHGILTMAKIWQLISEQLLAPADRTCEYKAEFLQPVYAGQQIDVHVTETAQRIDFTGFCGDTAVIKGYAVKKAPHAGADE